MPTLRWPNHTSKHGMTKGTRLQGMHTRPACNARLCKQKCFKLFSTNPENQLPRSMQTANFPLDQFGCTYHVGTKRGECANRILGVGSVGRARKLGQLLKPLPGHDRLQQVESSRGFLTVTGQWKGHAVSIVTHLMGFANIDLALRECRAIVDAPMLVIRVGTCGSLNSHVGQLHIPAQGSVAILRNPDAFRSSFGESTQHRAYRFTQCCMPDAELTQTFVNEATALMGAEGVQEGLNASADSFFSSQGRVDDNFDDRNADVLADLQEQYPEAKSLEMETFHLFDLAQCSRGSIRAAAGAISLACRVSNRWIEPGRLHDLELLAGKAALNSLVSTPVTSQEAAS